MSKQNFYILCTCVLILSFGYTFLLGCSDRPSLFIACIGSLATFATLYIAYQIFLNYSATADIQKKQFELVNAALEFFISKHFFAHADSHIYYCYFTKSRLDYLANGLIEQEFNTKRVLMSVEMVDFFYDFQNKIDHHFFPYSLRSMFMTFQPNSLVDLSWTVKDLDSTDKEFKNEVIIYGSSKDTRLGQPMMNVEMNISDFINRWNLIRTSLQGFLNDKLQDSYKIVDE
ncbi:MAG TPA: hypothetical protein VHB54_06810 [Mucilaginibacter sp.]|nr:hypothetical protein [Mucilaginibacter sp.]